MNKVLPWAVAGLIMFGGYEEVQWHNDTRAIASAESAAANHASVIPRGACGPAPKKDCHPVGTPASLNSLIHVHVPRIPRIPRVHRILRVLHPRFTIRHYIRGY